MKILFLLIYLYHSTNTAVKAKCVTSSIIDAGQFSEDLKSMRETLGGHTDVDLWFPFYKEPSPFGQVVITCPCELECYDFDAFLTRPCRWRNEKNSCNGQGDELNFMKMRGRWGIDEGETIFGKTDSPDGFFMLAGIEKKMPKDYSAMFVSDPIQCQQGDGLVTLRHWTSPGVKVRVCTRPPSMYKRYDWCSEPLKRNESQEAKVIIPGSIMHTFEIVVEAYSFTLDAFGKQGGVAAIDDLTYNASAIYECKMIPHIEPLPEIDIHACEAVHCDFEFGDCMKKLKRSGWKTSAKAVGTETGGIRGNLEGDFGYIRGPGSYSLTLGPFTLVRPFALEFCYYVVTKKAKLVVYVEEKKTKTRERIYQSDEINNGASFWTCEKLMLRNTTYDYVEFLGQGLHSENAYLGLDQISFVDPLKGIGACDSTQRQGEFNQLK